MRALADRRPRSETGSRGTRIAASRGLRSVRSVGSAAAGGHVPNHQAKKKRAVGYPPSLAIAVAALCALTGGSIAWWNYRASKENAGELARALFDHVAEQTADATRDFLGHAPPAVETLRHTFPLVASELRPDALGRWLLAALRANPRFTWVSWSDSSGGFIGAYRGANGALRVDLSRLVEGNGIADEYSVAM